MNGLNPLTLLDSVLADYASPRARRAIHSLILLAAVVLTIVLTAEGNWQAAVGSLIAAVYSAANQANTPAETLSDVDEEEDEEDLSYEEAGGLPFPTDYDESALYGDGAERGDNPEDGDPHRT